MSDLICRNTMMRCQTPGMCSPHGGCRETEPVSSVWLEQLRSEFRQAVRDRDALKAENKELSEFKAYMVSMREAHGFDSWAEVLVKVDRLEDDLLEAKQFQPIGEACLTNRDTLRASLGLKPGDNLHEHVEALRKNSERYEWLRDSSESTHQFYLSTPIWFAGVKFIKENVDSTIDAAMGNGEQP